MEHCSTGRCSSALLCKQSVDDEGVSGPYNRQGTLCTLYFAHCTLCTMCTAHYTVLCTEHFTHYTHCMLHTTHCRQSVGGGGGVWLVSSCCCCRRSCGLLLHARLYDTYISVSILHIIYVYMCIYMYMLQLIWIIS